MRKLEGLITAVALIAGIALAMSGPASAAGGKGLKDFTVTSKLTGTSKHGDTAIFHERLKAKGQTVGKSKIRCRFTEERVKCSGTWRFDDGLIKAKGKLGDGKVSKLDIKRGTGAYKGAEGKVLLKQVAERRNKETFNFTR
jgi:hypothetical protein